jgi:hypothetical protein
MADAMPISARESASSPGTARSSNRGAVIVLRNFSRRPAIYEPPVNQELHSRTSDGYLRYYTSLPFTRCTGSICGTRLAFTGVGLGRAIYFVMRDVDVVFAKVVIPGDYQAASRS